MEGGADERGHRAAEWNSSACSEVALLPSEYPELGGRATGKPFSLVQIHVLQTSWK